MYNWNGKSNKEREVLFIQRLLGRSTSTSSLAQYGEFIPIEGSSEPDSKLLYYKDIVESVEITSVLEDNPDISDTEVINFVLDDSGYKITEIKEEYGVGPDNTSYAGILSWSSSAENLRLNALNRYLWNKTTITLSNGSSDSSYKIISSFIDNSGEITVTELIEYYAISPYNTYAPDLIFGQNVGEWSTEKPIGISIDNRYVWNYNIIRFNDQSSQGGYHNSMIIGDYGNQLREVKFTPNITELDYNINSNGVIVASDLWWESRSALGSSIDWDHVKDITQIQINDVIIIRGIARVTVTRPDQSQETYDCTTLVNAKVSQISDSSNNEYKIRATTLNYVIENEEVVAADISRLESEIEDLDDKTDSLEGDIIGLDLLATQSLADGVLTIQEYNDLLDKYNSIVAQYQDIEDLCTTLGWSKDLSSPGQYIPEYLELYNAYLDLCEDYSGGTSGYDNVGILKYLVDPKTINGVDEDLIGITTIIVSGQEVQVGKFSQNSRNYQGTELSPAINNFLDKLNAFNSILHKNDSIEYSVSSSMSDFDLALAVLTSTIASLGSTLEQAEKSSITSQLNRINTLYNSIKTDYDSKWNSTNSQDPRYVTQYAQFISAYAEYKNKAEAIRDITVGSQIPNQYRTDYNTAYQSLSTAIDNLEDYYLSSTKSIQNITSTLDTDITNLATILNETRNNLIDIFNDMVITSSERESLSIQESNIKSSFESINLEATSLGILSSQEYLAVKKAYDALIIYTNNSYSYDTNGSHTIPTDETSKGLLSELVLYAPSVLPSSGDEQYIYSDILEYNGSELNTTTGSSIQIDGNTEKSYKVNSDYVNKLNSWINNFSKACESFGSKVTSSLKNTSDTIIDTLDTDITRLASVLNSTRGVLFSIFDDGYVDASEQRSTELQCASYTVLYNNIVKRAESLGWTNLSIYTAVQTAYNALINSTYNYNTPTGLLTHLIEYTAPNPFPSGGDEFCSAVKTYGTSNVTLDKTDGSSETISGDTSGGEAYLIQSAYKSKIDTWVNNFISATEAFDKYVDRYQVLSSLISQVRLTPSNSIYVVDYDGKVIVPEPVAPSTDNIIRISITSPSEVELNSTQPSNFVWKINGYTVSHGNHPSYIDINLNNNENPNDPQSSKYSELDEINITCENILLDYPVRNPTDPPVVNIPIESLSIAITRSITGADFWIDKGSTIIVKDVNNGNSLSPNLVTITAASSASGNLRKPDTNLYLKVWKGDSSTGTLYVQDWGQVRIPPNGQTFDPSVSLYTIKLYNNNSVTADELDSDTIQVIPTGASSIFAALTNSSGQVPASSDSNHTPTIPAPLESTKIELYIGGVKVSPSSPDLTYNHIPHGCTISPDGSQANPFTDTVNIMTMTSDAASVDLTVTYNGQTYTKTFPVVKLIEGSPASAVLFLNTNYSATQTIMNLWGTRGDPSSSGQAIGWRRTLTLDSNNDPLPYITSDSSNVRVGDTVWMRCDNSTKTGYTYIGLIVGNITQTLITVTTDNQGNPTGSLGMIDKGDAGTADYVWEFALSSYTYTRNLRYTGSSTNEITVIPDISGYVETPHFNVSPNTLSVINSKLSIPFTNDYDKVTVTMTGSSASDYVCELSVIDITEYNKNFGSISALPNEVIINGDYFFATDRFTADNYTFEAGFPYVKVNNSWTQLSGTSPENAQKLLGVLSSVLNDRNNPNSSSSIYGWFQTLAAQSAVIQTLFSEALTILNPGYIKSSNFSEVNGFVSQGFKLNSSGLGQFGEGTQLGNVDIRITDNVLGTPVQLLTTSKYAQGASYSVTAKTRWLTDELFSSATHWSTCQSPYTDNPTVTYNGSNYYPLSSQFMFKPGESSDYVLVFDKACTVTINFDGLVSGIGRYGSYDLRIDGRGYHWIIDPNSTSSYTGLTFTKSVSAGGSITINTGAYPYKPQNTGNERDGVRLLGIVTIGVKVNNVTAEAVLCNKRVRGYSNTSTQTLPTAGTYNFKIFPAGTYLLNTLSFIHTYRGGGSVTSASYINYTNLSNFATIEDGNYSLVNSTIAGQTVTAFTKNGSSIYFFTSGGNSLEYSTIPDTSEFATSGWYNVSGSITLVGSQSSLITYNINASNSNADIGAVQPYNNIHANNFYGTHRGYVNGTDLAAYSGNYKVWGAVFN